MVVSVPGTSSVLSNACIFLCLLSPGGCVRLRQIDRETNGAEGGSCDVCNTEKKCGYQSYWRSWTKNPHPVSINPEETHIMFGAASAQTHVYLGFRYNNRGRGCHSCFWWRFLTQPKVWKRYRPILAPCSAAFAIVALRAHPGECSFIIIIIIIIIIITITDRSWHLARPHLQ